jgi:hypothetical protein
MTELELFAVCVTMMKSGQRTILMRDDTIVAVHAEIERLRGEVERLTGINEKLNRLGSQEATLCFQLKSEVERLREELEQITGGLVMCPNPQCDGVLDGQDAQDLGIPKCHTCGGGGMISQERANLLAERKAIAEAVRGQMTPPWVLAECIEKGEVK